VLLRRDSRTRCTVECTVVDDDLWKVFVAIRVHRIVVGACDRLDFGIDAFDGDVGGLGVVVVVVGGPWRRQLLDSSWGRCCRRQKRRSRGRRLRMR
jgi:hypothetical protein